MATEKKSSNKVDSSLFKAAIEGSSRPPEQRVVAPKIEKERVPVLTSMYFKIDVDLKKDLSIYLANRDGEGRKIQNYLHDLIEEDLERKKALSNYNK